MTSTRGRIISLTAAVAIHLALSHCTAPGHLASTEPPRIVRVLVYNIHAGKDAAGMENLAAVASLIRETSADLVLLQEVDQGTRRSANIDQPAVLAGRTGFHVAFGSPLDYDGGKYGIAILSRWPIATDTLFLLPNDPADTPSARSPEPRGVLRADVLSPYGIITLFNTHIDASREDRWRLQQARTLAAVMGDAARTESLVLLGGDLNSTPEGGVQAYLRATGLRDAHTECGSGEGLTFPADSAVKRIDYLYLSEGMRCTRAEALAARASDHLPLLVEVVVPRR
ncbi:MAG TPA: endonuclease/exonuclease/phosphatase family protein [Gemmatimonadaceae bacterium]|nr:endonuclease/exonuclease/phosphatase family protein [Gemmatimonadaceae bacterium]